MIPTYQPNESHLRVSIESVLDQDFDSSWPEIEVVDDCSPDIDVEAIVKRFGRGRVAFSRNSENLGLAGCWNRCIERARGEWIHILHQDDYVLPGFYQRIRKAIASHPDVCLAATRSFFVDSEAQIMAVTGRLRRLENGGRQADDFFYDTPIQCPGVVVRRDFYNKNGGFASDLKYVLDREMWARAIAEGGGIIVPDVLACYRRSERNETSRIMRTADGLKEINTLNHLFSARFPRFDLDAANLKLRNLAIWEARQREARGDTDSAQAYRNFWKCHTPLSLRLRSVAGSLLRTIIG